MASPVNRVLIDTDLLSEIRKGRNGHAVAWSIDYLGHHPRFTVSALTVAEAVRGYRKAGQEQRLGKFLRFLPTSLEVLPLETSVAIIAGQIDGDLERTGQTIGRIDPLIAATAIHHDLTLVTGNTRHYQRVIDLGYHLRLQDWRQTQ